MFWKLDVDLIKFNCVTALILKQSGFIEMQNNIKQSFSFFPQTYGAQTFSLVILCANYFVFYRARQNTLHRLVKKAAVGVFMYFFVEAMFAVIACW